MSPVQRSKHGSVSPLWKRYFQFGIHPGKHLNDGSLQGQAGPGTGFGILSASSSVFRRWYDSLRFTFRITQHLHPRKNRDDGAPSNSKSRATAGPPGGVAARGHRREIPRLRVPALRAIAKDTGHSARNDNARAGAGWRISVRKASPRGGGVSYMKPEAPIGRLAFPGKAT